MEPRPWSICLSSSDINLFISHGDIPPAIQTPASSVTMESAFSLECFSAIAADLDYVLLLGQPLPEFLCTAWHISSQPAPSVPLVLGQRVLLVSPASRTYFGRLKSIVRLEDSYLVASSLSLDLKIHTWSSLCLLSPLHMVLSFQSPVTSISLHHSSRFPGHVESATHVSHPCYPTTNMDETVL